MREIRPSGSMRGGDCVPSTLRHLGTLATPSQVPRIHCCLTPGHPDAADSGIRLRASVCDGRYRVDFDKSHASIATLPRNFGRITTRRQCD